MSATYALSSALHPAVRFEWIHRNEPHSTQSVFSIEERTFALIDIVIDYCTRDVNFCLFPYHFFLMLTLNLDSISAHYVQTKTSPVSITT